MDPKRDTKHRYAPRGVICKGKLSAVNRWTFHPAGTHKSAIVPTMGALEATTERGSRWFGCDRAYINAELRMVVIGFDARDEVRRTWQLVPRRLQVAPQVIASDLSDEMRAFVSSYIEAALWSSTDNDYHGEGDPRNLPHGESNGGEPLEDNYGEDDIAPEARKAMETDCLAFVAKAGAKLEGLEPSQVAHDFWLTRNGHGAGFWDRGLGQLGEDLSKIAESFGSIDLYVGDDGKVYGQ